MPNSDKSLADSSTFESTHFLMDGSKEQDINDGKSEEEDQTWNTPTICKFCNREEEDTDHLLILCPQLMKIWKELEVLFDIKSHPPSLKAAFTSWRLNIKQQDREAWDFCFAATCWSIWLERNSRIFEGKARTETRIIQSTKELISLWRQNLKGKSGGKIDKTLISLRL